MIIARVLLVAIALGLAAWLGWELYDAGYFTREALIAWAEQSGLWAPLIIIGAIALAVIIGPIPTVPIAVASGTLFGLPLGVLYSMTGGLLGAVTSFWMARLAGRPLIERLTHGRIAFCENCSDRKLFLVVLGSRFIPVFSFALVSYGAGLTQMSTARFLLATGLGMLPMTVVFVALGTSLAINPWLAGSLGAAAVLLILILPRLAQRYNLFGLSDSIRQQPKEDKG